MEQYPQQEDLTSWLESLQHTNALPEPYPQAYLQQESYPQWVPPFQSALYPQLTSYTQSGVAGPSAMGTEWQEHLADWTPGITIQQTESRTDENISGTIDVIAEILGEAGEREMLKRPFPPCEDESSAPFSGDQAVSCYLLLSGRSKNTRSDEKY